MFEISTKHPSTNTETKLLIVSQTEQNISLKHFVTATYEHFIFPSILK